MPRVNIVLGTYLDIVRAYAGEHEAHGIEERARAGIDVTDELYEALVVHDEEVAQSWLDESHLAYD